VEAGLPGGAGWCRSLTFNLLVLASRGAGSLVSRTELPMIGRGDVAITRLKTLLKIYRLDIVVPCYASRDYYSGL
jgi:hypothetical protein